MASEAQIQRQLLAQQRAKFARAAKDRENRERQSWEMRQSRRRSVSYPSAPKDVAPALTMPALAGRQSSVQVLDDIVPLRKPNDPLFEWLNKAVSGMMLGAGGATATNATPQAQNENITAASVAKAREQTRKFFLSEVAKWNSPAPSKRFISSSGLMETRVADQLTNLENRGMDVVRVQFSNGGEVVLQPGESFTVAPEYGRMEVVTPMQRESEPFWGRGIDDWGTTFPSYGGISRNSQPRSYPRRSEGREDLEELEGFYRKQIRDMEQAYQARVRDLESALLRMQRQLSDVMALQSRQIMIMNPMTG